MTITETVVWGTFSGVLAVFFSFVLKTIVLSTLVPWFEDLRYKSVRLSGEWKGKKDTPDFDLSYCLMLKQNANHVTGTLKIEKKSKGTEPSETLNFLITGDIWEGFLSFTAKSTDDTRLAFGSDLYQIKEGGRKLDGIHVYRSLRRDCVCQFSVVLERS